MSVWDCSVFVLSCVASGLATGLITRPRSFTTCV
jgi:3-polyprenyl-4-hydroxybenzoate decarboxylase